MALSYLAPGVDAPSMDCDGCANDFSTSSKSQWPADDHPRSRGPGGSRGCQQPLAEDGLAQLLRTDDAARVCLLSRLGPWARFVADLRGEPLPTPWWTAPGQGLGGLCSALAAPAREPGALRVGRYPIEEVLRPLADSPRPVLLVHHRPGALQFGDAAMLQQRLGARGAVLLHGGQGSPPEVLGRNGAGPFAVVHGGSLAGPEPRFQVVTVDDGEVLVEPWVGVQTRQQWRRDTTGAEGGAWRLHLGPPRSLPTPTPRPTPVTGVLTRWAPPPWADGELPWPILAPYERPETFAGRDHDVAALIALLNRPRLLTLAHAPSGAGKSSLLLAGLRPRQHLGQRGFALDRQPERPGLADRLASALLTAAHPRR